MRKWFLLLLFFIRQDSLSADSKTLMLVCVSPVVQSAEESMCSLNFAARVRTVELGKVGSRTKYFNRFARLIFLTGLILSRSTNADDNGMNGGEHLH